jgi:hypothetical protein
MTECAALLAGFLAGMPIEQLDRSRVYEVLASLVGTMTLMQKTVARTCALKHGIRYRVVKDVLAGGQKQDLN